MPVSIALFQPDIAQNAGTLLRTAACFAIPVHIIEPCGFAFNESKFRRAGMDYLDHVRLHRHTSFTRFQEWRAQNQPASRLLLLTTKASSNYAEASYEEEDILLLGQESQGAPPDVHDAADLRLRIPLQPQFRSLNVAIAGAIVLGEALRQTGHLTTLAGVTNED